MPPEEPSGKPTPVRRPPPPFVELEVASVTPVNPRLVRIGLAGPSLSDMATPEPAASVRLLVPAAGGTDLVVPEWNGNEFLLPDGSRPLIRTFTPLRFDPAAGSVELEVVVHEGGAVSAWAQRCGVGDVAALSGPGAGWTPPTDMDELLVFGDETALPAIGQVLAATAALAGPVRISVHVELAAESARRDLHAGADTEVHWHTSDPDRAPLARLVDAASGISSVGDRTHVWAAGEAAAVQGIRQHFLRDLSVPRARASIRGYWKQR